MRYYFDVYYLEEYIGRMAAYGKTPREARRVLHANLSEGGYHKGYIFMYGAH